MKKLTNRRGRRYDPQPLDGIARGDVGYAAAILDEARERCIDLIVDMTDAAMWSRPAGCPFSAGDLVVHMNWAEYAWLPKIGRHRLDDATVRTIERGNLKHLYNPDPWSMPVHELVSLCRQTRDQLMIPCLAQASGTDQHVPSDLPEGKGPTTVGGIIMHVIASWVYHSGQVGLLTMQNGLDYQWAFE